MTLKIATVKLERKPRKENPFAADVATFADHVENSKVAKGERIIATVQVPEGLSDSTAKTYVHEAAKALGLSARTVPSEAGTISFWLSTRKRKDDAAEVASEDSAEREADDNA